MAYSDNLRLTLIATGAEAGTWGTTTNTNLGTILEDAITGYATVSVTSAAQAFTAADGAYDQARNAVIRLTTTTSANFSVYAVPYSKTYVIYNDSAYAATIYNSTVAGNTTAAGVGVAIPAGKVMTVWSTGANFYVQNSHVIGTVVGNVTGDLTGNVTGNVTGNTNGVVTATAGSTAVTASVGDNDTSIATTAFVQTALQALHPVGSIYINATNSTNPGTLLGFGTWTAFGAGRVPVGFDAGNPLFDTAEETGGSANAITVSHTHTATVTDPGHLHTYTNPQSPSGGTNSYQNGPQGYTWRAENIASGNTSTATTGISVSNSTTGSSGTNANYQPYITVYMWKRTA
jgi:hypothetical protein